MALKLFISYSHQDQTALDELLEGLRPLEREGLIAPWTDRLIEVGNDWQAAIETALNDCDVGLFLLSKPFMASDFIHAKELEPLLDRAEQDSVRLVPILLRPCDWTSSVLGKRNPQPLPGWDRYIEAEQDRFKRDENWDEVTQKIRAWAEAAPASLAEATWQGSPYPGLRAFDEREAPIFTGRRETTEALLDKLDRGVRFLAVYGPSGSGKSSLVRAGLLPAWRQRHGTDKALPVLVMKPDELGTGDPILSLATKLCPLLTPGNAVRDLATRLRKDTGTIGDHIDDILRRQDKDSECLLIIRNVSTSYGQLSIR